MMRQKDLFRVYNAVLLPQGAGVLNSPEFSNCKACLKSQISKAKPWGSAPSGSYSSGGFGQSPRFALLEMWGSTQRKLCFFADY